MLSGSVQAKSFHQTFTGVYENGLDTAVSNLWSQANQFMSTISPENVLDVNVVAVPVGNGDLHYSITVIYLQV